MLSTPTPFPQQGSNALLGRIPVRIVQPRADGHVLVSGERSPGRNFTKTVALGDLADAAPPADPIAAWIDQRLAQATSGHPTPAGDLHRDLTAWCLDRGLDSHSVPSAKVLNEKLRECGFSDRRRMFGRPTGPISLLCFNVTLRSIAEVA